MTRPSLHASIHPPSLPCGPVLSIHPQEEDTYHTPRDWLLSTESPLFLPHERSSCPPTLILKEPNQQPPHPSPVPSSTLKSRCDRMTLQESLPSRFTGKGQISISVLMKLLRRHVLLHFYLIDCSNTDKGRQGDVEQTGEATLAQDV